MSESLVVSDSLVKTYEVVPIQAPLWSVYWKRMSRHRGPLVLAFCGILLGSIAATRMLPDRYLGRMKFLVMRHRVDPVVTPQLSIARENFPELTEQDLNSEVEAFKSTDLREKVVTQCGLDKLVKEPWFSSLAMLLARPTGQDSSMEAPMARGLKALDRGLDVRAIPKTNVIEVLYESNDPRLAARVLSSLANVYLEKHLAMHHAPGTFEFFRKEAEQYERELATVQARLAGYTRDVGIASGNAEKEITIRKLTDFEAAWREAVVSIAETERRISLLEKQLAATPSRLTTQLRTGENSGLEQQLQSLLLSLELKRSELGSKFAPGYRPLEDLDRQIAQTRAAIAEGKKSPLREETTDLNPTHSWMTSELAKENVNLAALRERAAKLAATIAAYRERANELEQKGIVLQDLMRAAKTAEENYILYRRKQEEARISNELDRKRILNVSLLESPSVPGTPTGPRKIWVLVLGGILACVITIAFGFTLDYLDPCFRSADELKAVLAAPMLARIPVKTSLLLSFSPTVPGRSFSVAASESASDLPGDADRSSNPNGGAGK